MNLYYDKIFRFLEIMNYTVRLFIVDLFGHTSSCKLDHWACTSIVST